jgi:TPR repeat protein
MKKVIILLFSTILVTNLWSQKRSIADLEKDFHNRFITTELSNDVRYKLTVPTDEDYIAVVKKDYVEIVKKANKRGMEESRYCQGDTYKETYSCFVEVDNDPSMKKVLKEGIDLYIVWIIDDEEGAWGLASYVLINGRWKYFCTPSIARFFEGKDNPEKEDFLSAFQAAEKGNEIAQFSVGRHYLHGDGVEQNTEKAIYWFKKVIAQNGEMLDYAMLALGDAYNENEDYQNAFLWYSKYADKNNEIAQYNLGDLYMLGKGVEQNYSIGKKWIEKSANQGFAMAEYGLGYIFEHGLGVPVNEKEAIKWYIKAAEQDYSSAKEALKKFKEKR